MGADVVNHHSPSLVPDKEPWMDQAACIGKDVEFFVNDNPVQQKKAKEFCLTRCSVQKNCLVWILIHEPQKRRAGIVGGRTPSERRKLAVQLGLAKENKKENEDDD